MYSREEAPTAVTGRAQISTVVDKKSMFFHLFEFLAQEYGNDPEMLLKRLTTILMFGATGQFIKSRNIRQMLRLISNGLTIGIFGIDFVMHAKHYIKSQKEKKSDPYKKRLTKIIDILDISFIEDIPSKEFLLGPVLSTWLVQNPRIESEDLQVIGYFDINKNEKIETDIDFNTETVDVGVLFKYKKQPYLLDLEFYKTVTGHISINHSFLLSEKINDYDCHDLHKHLLRQFVNTLNLKENVLKFDSWGSFYTCPRRQIQETLNQFDVMQLVKEIRWVLEHKGRRMYVLVGRQGVGKSSVLRAIEYILSDILIIHLAPDDFEYCSRIEDRFSTCKLFQPLLLVIEELDACGFKEKNQTTGAFLNCIDEVNRDLNMVIICSVNDSSLVHPTIINRPGRSDIVREIKPPQNVDDVIFVMKNRLEISLENYKDDFTIEKIDFSIDLLQNLAKKCLNNNFTQAEIANGVIEHALIQIGLAFPKNTKISVEVFADYIKQGINSQLTTRNAIKSCDFKNVDPNEISVDDGCDCEKPMEREYKDTVCVN